MDLKSLKERIEYQETIRRLLTTPGILMDTEGRKYRVVEGDLTRPTKIVLEPLDHDALYHGATRRVIKNPDELREYKIILPE